MNITFEEIQAELARILINNAPVRVPPPYGSVGKKGTNMESPYPGNLQQNGIELTSKGARLNYNKVGYIGYANLRSKKPQFIEKSVDELVNCLIQLGGTRID